MALSSFTAVAIFHSVTLWQRDRETSACWNQIRLQIFLLFWSHLRGYFYKSFQDFEIDGWLEAPFMFSRDEQIIASVFAQQSTTVGVEGVWSPPCLSCNSFPLRLPQHKPAWSSHLGDHTFRGSDVSHLHSSMLRRHLTALLCCLSVKLQRWMLLASL